MLLWSIRLPAIEPADAGSLVKDFTIRSEKYSTTRYIASFDITFEDAAINQLLASRAIPLATSQSPGITILPIVLNGDKVGSVGEAWRQAWLDLDLAKGRVNEVRYRNAAGQEFATSMIDILSQVITHGPYHRGQIAKIVARSGGTPINTDFIMFTRDVE